MALKRKRDLTITTAVTAGAPVTINIPRNLEHHVLWLQGGDANGMLLATMITQVQVLVNSKVQRTMTGQQLNDLNALNGSAFDESPLQNTTTGATIQPGNAGYIGVLGIYLAELWRKLLGDQEFFAWGTGNINSFQLQLTINAAAATPFLSAWAEYANPLATVTTNGVAKTVPVPMGVIAKWFAPLIPVNGIQQKIDNLPLEDAYQSVHFFDPAYFYGGAITVAKPGGFGNNPPNACGIKKVTVSVNGNVIHERTKSENDASLIARGLYPNATRYDWVADADDIIASALAMDVFMGQKVVEFLIVLDLWDGTARNIPCIAVRNGPPE